MSFRAFVLVGIVTLVTAFYQSTQPSAFTVTKGLTSRQRVELGPFPLNSMRQAALSGISSPSHPLAVAHAVLGSQIYLLANRSGAAEVATKTVSSWSNALDKPGLFEINAPNDDQCGLFDVGAPSHDQRGPFDAQDDNQCALKESAVASLEAFKLADPVRIDTFALPLL